MFSFVNRLALMSFVLATASQNVQRVEAHGRMMKPLAKFTTSPDFDITRFSGIVKGTQVLPGENYWGPEEPKVVLFTKKFKESNFKTLLDLVQHQTLEPGATAECGYTNPHNKQPLPEMVEWIHIVGLGFIHQGPCEIWCDNERVFSNENCEKHFPGYPARLPYAKDKCVGKSVLRFIWLALHNGETWQVFTNCAGIEGGPDFKPEILQGQKQIVDVAGADADAPKLAATATQRPATAAPATQRPKGAATAAPVATKGATAGHNSTIVTMTQNEGLTHVQSSAANYSAESTATTTTQKTKCNN